MSEQIITAPLDQVVESPMHHRTHWGDLEALGASLKARGFLQIPEARQRGGHFELVFGHRRRRAAELAGLDEMPLRLVELDDDEVVERQLIENAEREDAHPMDEAEAFELLQRSHSLEDIAARFGRDVAYVRTRLKLTALSEPVRAMFTAGDFDVERAYLVARVPDEKVQKRVAATIRDGYRDHHYPRDLKQCREVVERYAMRTLRGAPFSTKDPELVPEAGACTTCPKNTEAAADLFSDFEVKSGQCLDEACFKKKTAAGYKRRAAEVKKAGGKVLKVKECKGLFHGKSLNSSKYISPNAKPAGLKASYRQLLGEHLPPPVLAKDDAGAPRELLELKAVKAAAKKAKISLTPPKGTAAATSKKAKASPAIFDPDGYTARDERREMIDSWIEANLPAALTEAPALEGMRAATLMVALGETWAANAYAKKAGLGEKGKGLYSGTTSTKLLEAISAAAGDELLRHLFGIFMQSDMYIDASDGWHQALAPLGLDIAAQTAKIRAEQIDSARTKGLQIKGEEAPAPPKKKAPAKKKARKKAGSK